MVPYMYLVTVNDRFIEYGDYVYLIGIFDSKEKAAEAVRENTITIGAITVEPKITEVLLDQINYIKYDKTFERLDCEMLLGGYEE